MTPGAERLRSTGDRVWQTHCSGTPETGLPWDDPSAASHPSGTTVRLPSYLTVLSALANISFIAIIGKNNIFAV